MFISEKNKKAYLYRFFAYCGITAFIALFGFVYEQFSHGVNSNYMWFAWIWPLLFGVGVYGILCFSPIKKVPGLLAECFYNLGVALLTTRFILMGVLEIYGKTNDRMVLIYLILLIIFISLGVIFYCYGLIFLRKKGTKA